MRPEECLRRGQAALAGRLLHSECAIHGWDLRGDDDTSWRLLGQFELFKHAVTAIGTGAMTARGVAAGEPRRRPSPPASAVTATPIFLSRSRRQCAWPWPNRKEIRPSSRTSRPGCSCCGPVYPPCCCHAIHPHARGVTRVAYRACNCLVSNSCTSAAIHVPANRIRNLALIGLTSRCTGPPEQLPVHHDSLPLSPRSGPPRNLEEGHGPASPAQAGEHDPRRCSPSPFPTANATAASSPLPTSTSTASTENSSWAARSTNTHTPPDIPKNPQVTMRTLLRAD
jgi:hypothetical protein